MSEMNRRAFMGGVAASLGLLGAAGSAAEGGRVRAGVIGLGGRGRMITQMVQEHGGYEIAAVADYFPDVANAAGDSFGVPAERRFSGLQGYRRLLDSGVDAVFLETPPYCFPDHVEAAVEAGCHVFMAKPVACDVPGCLRVDAAAKRAQAGNRVFLIDFQKRTHPLIIEGIARLHKGEIGAPGLITSLYTDESFADPPFTENVESRLQHLIWVNDDALGGGYLVNAGIHAVDAALWMADARPVSATGASRIARKEPHGDSHDVYSITYEFADGLILNHRGEHLRNRFEFHCDCVAHCQNGYLETAYAGQVQMLGIDTAWAGGEVKDLYATGARHNIAGFHDCIVKGDYSNPTVAPSITANLAVMLGREAALRRERVTWDQLLAEQRHIEPDLRGLA